MSPATYGSVALIGILVWVIIIYNRFIRERNFINEAWSGIDVQLKRRYNLIPNLVEVVKGYAKHEQSVLEQVTQMRTSAQSAEGIKDRGNWETKLSGKLKNIFALVENYPELKADTSFLKLQDELVGIEDQLQYARRYYNGTVRNFNIRVDAFPSLFIARSLKFEKEEFFEIEFANERAAPEVELNRE